MSIQNVRFDSQDPNGFMALAEQAAALERQGLWNEAKDMWGAAGKVARKAANVKWAQSRVTVCETAIKFEWGVAA